MGGKARRKAQKGKKIESVADLFLDQCSASEGKECVVYGRPMFHVQGENDVIRRVATGVGVHGLLYMAEPSKGFSQTVDFRSPRLSFIVIPCLNPIKHTARP